MISELTRERFARIVEIEGRQTVAKKIKCSATQVSFIAKGQRAPGLELAHSIERTYKIPMQTWIDLDGVTK